MLNHCLSGALERRTLPRAEVSFWHYFQRMRSSSCGLSLLSRIFGVCTTRKKPVLAGSRVLAQPEVKPFPFYICRDATKCVLLSFFCLIKSVCPKIWAKPLPKNPKTPLPVDVCGPKWHPFVVCVYRWAWFYFSP